MIYLDTAKQFQAFQYNTINFHESTCLLDKTLTHTTTLVQSGPESNGNKEVLQHFAKLSNRSFTTGHSLLL